MSREAFSFINTNLNEMTSYVNILLKCGNKNYIYINYILIHLVFHRRDNDKYLFLWNNSDDIILFWKYRYRKYIIFISNENLGCVHKFFKFIFPKWVLSATKHHHYTECLYVVQVFHPVIRLFILKQSEFIHCCQPPTTNIKLLN